MRTALKNSPTKDKLLDSAQKLVLTRGFSATTVDDVCKDAHLTKGSFFHYFKSKDEIGLAILERYCCDTHESLMSGSCRAEHDPLKRIYSFLDFMIKAAKERGGRGCLLGTMAQEMAESNPEIREICKKSFSGISEALRKDLALAKAKYGRGKDIEPRELADHFLAILQGSMLIGKVRKESSIAVTGLKHFKKYLEILFGR